MCAVYVKVQKEKNKQWRREKKIEVGACEMCKEEIKEIEAQKAYIWNNWLEEVIEFSQKLNSTIVQYSKVRLTQEGQLYDAVHIQHYLLNKSMKASIKWRH